MDEIRNTGLKILGNIPWGSHLCAFYETQRDLMDIIIPFFNAGLENNECCIWITPPYSDVRIDDAKNLLYKSIPEFDRYISKGSMEFKDGLNWYLSNNSFYIDDIIKKWDGLLQKFKKSKYTGIRVSGDVSWLEEKFRKDFKDYEMKLNQFISKHPMIILCTYPLEFSKGLDVLDAVKEHQFAIARRSGNWQVIETPELQAAKAQIQMMNEELEAKVEERTRELQFTNKKLLNEICEREKAEVLLKQSEDNIRTIIDA
ncbi:MAG TPA: MEDS domain-containing protein, partial [Candidatus Nitrosocosmicus sp.]